VSSTPTPGRARPTRQQIAAAATRQEILAAARRLFGERGYVQTSIADIAEAAGVSIPTIYASVGQKQAVVLALIGFIDNRLGSNEARDSLLSMNDPVELLHAGLRVNRRLLEGYGDILAALRSAAEQEPAVAEARARGRGFHELGSRRAAQRLAELGALKEGLDVETAAGIIWVLTDWETIEKLRRDLKWDLDQAEAHLHEAVQRAVLQ